MYVTFFLLKNEHSSRFQVIFKRSFSERRAIIVTILPQFFLETVKYDRSLCRPLARVQRGSECLYVPVCVCVC